MQRRGIPAWAPASLIVLIAIVLLGMAVSAFAGTISQWVDDAQRLQQEPMHKLASLRTSFDSPIHISRGLLDDRAADPAPLGSVRLHPQAGADHRSCFSALIGLVVFDPVGHALLAPLA